MSERKLAALLAVTFLLVAALSGGATSAILIDVESVTGNISAPANMSGDSGADPSTQSVDPKHTSMDVNLHAGESQSQMPCSPQCAGTGADARLSADRPGRYTSTPASLISEYMYRNETIDVL